MPKNAAPTSQYIDTQITDFYLDVWVPRKVPANVNDKTVTIDAKYHQRPDLMAFDYFGTPNLWWIFAVRNVDIINDPIFDHVSGIQIIVPAQEVINGLV